MIAAFPNTPAHSAVLEQGPFGDQIKASLTWFPVGGELKLGWDVLLTFPKYERQYDVVVDANTGEILYSHQKVQFVAAALNVYHRDGGGSRQLTNVPLSIGDYGLPSPIVGQDNWRWCHKCQGLFFNGHATKGKCPAGGAHDSAGSFDYMIQFWVAPGENKWRWCHKCERMYFSGGPSQGVCPSGGAHENAGSGDYTLISDPVGGPGQYEWRRCKKCTGLHYGGFPDQGACPAGGKHDHAGSSNYSLLQFSKAGQPFADEAGAAAA